MIDARTLPEGQVIETDVCIIGAGAAGITLAREFINQPIRVCLLESGGLEFDEGTQSLYDGEITGLPYTPLKAARVRYFGGTTNHWGGWCRPLDKLDFEKRDWIPYSGWPFGKSHLDPYYQRAQSICELGPFAYDANSWATKDTPLLGLTPDRVLTTIFQFSPPTRFGKIYRQEIANAENISTYLYANVVEIETTETARAVTRVRLACLGGNRLSVSAKLYILATGGIENARLLLLSNKVNTAGLGNQNDLVGRFFMDTGELSSGSILLSDPNVSTDLYRKFRSQPGLARKIDGGSMEEFLTSRDDKEDILGWIKRGAEEPEYLDKVKPILEKSCVRCHNPEGVAFFRSLTSYREAMIAASVDPGENINSGLESPARQSARGALALTPEIQQRERLANWSAVMEEDEAIAELYRVKDPLKGIFRGEGDFWKNLSEVIANIDDIAIATYRKLSEGGVRGQLFRLLNIFETTPNPDSRVTLTTERDSLGQQKVELDWRLNDIDKRTIRRAHEVVSAELGRAGAGRLQIDLDDANIDWPSWLRHGWHHMGTTRMHIDPKQGVVDENCKVHGISNLFIAGSSVFPTCGYAQPTLTIVALATRLADHAKRIMA